MNKEMSFELDKLSQHTRDQMVETNKAWVRLTRLEQEYQKCSHQRDNLIKEIEVVKADHKIQSDKLGRMLLEEKI